MGSNPTLPIRRKVAQLAERENSLCDLVAVNNGPILYVVREGPFKARNWVQVPVGSFNISWVEYGMDS